MSVNLGLKGKVAVVTGAGGGIGREMVRVDQSHQHKKQVD